MTRVDLHVLVLLCLLLVLVKTTPNASQGMGVCYRRVGSEHPRTTSTVSKVARISGEFHHKEAGRCWRCPHVWRWRQPPARSTTCCSIRRCSPGAWGPEVLNASNLLQGGKKRLATHDEERIMLVKNSKQRLQKFREEVSQSIGQQKVDTWQSERDALAAQIQAEKADVSSHGIVARRRTGIGPGQTGGVEGRFCQGGRCWGSRIDVKDGTRC